LPHLTPLSLCLSVPLCYAFLPLPFALHLFFVSSCLCALVLRFFASPLCAFPPCVTLLPHPSSPPFAPLPLCHFALRFLPFIFVISVTRWFNFTFSAPASRTAAVQRTKLPSGDSLPRCRRLVQIQRQPPAFPPSKSGRAAPRSRVPAVHPGGKLAKWPNCYIHIRNAS
jgi:hypothetical protein